MVNNNDNSDFAIPLFLATITLIIGVFIGIKIAVEIESNKLITPSIKIECVEIDGSKKCDTTYTYINK